MATVRITSELKRDILHKIAGDFRPILGAHTKTFNYGISATDLYEEGLNCYLAEQGVDRAVFDRLPDSWKDSCIYISFRSVNGVEIPYEKRQMTLPSPVYAPDRMRADQGTLKVQSEMLEHVANNIRAWIAERDRLQAEHNAFVQGVNKILNACSTLKQAVEMWPQMVEVMPEHIKQRHLEPEQRTKKAKIEVDADLTDALNATLVGNKMTKAGL